MAAQKKRHASGGAQNMKMFYAVLALIAVVGIGAILYARTRASGMATEPLDMSQATDATTLLEEARGIPLGAADAPAQIIVFSDYTCPACGVWSGQVEPMLKTEFVNEGKVQLTYYDFPLGGQGQHRHGFAAARAARCAGDQDRFWEYHDQLFARQGEWSFSSSVPVSHFVQYARDLGLDAGAYENCLRSDEHAAVVTANRLLGETLGVGGTPTVFLNGRQIAEWNNYQAVRAAVQAAGGV